MIILVLHVFYMLNRMHSFYNIALNWLLDINTNLTLVFTLVIRPLRLPEIQIVCL